MASLNRVFLMGNLTRDPELRYTPSGAAVANLGLAVNRRYKNAAGDWVDEASFFTVIAWGRQAETCSQYLAKGRPILVEGRLQQRSWEAQDGQKRSVVEVVAERIQFLGGGRASEDGPGELEAAGAEVLEEEVPF
ncbi:MAG: single-stranded DNA-binding protein [Actinobacteria bacterium]|nr:single-stranded DNA-binding protein [Actinomycetota bacterium]